MKEESELNSALALARFWSDGGVYNKKCHKGSQKRPQ